jgi:hypothetical protein
MALQRSEARRERGSENAAMTPASARAWAVLTRLLVVAVFSQSIFAGVLLSGESWGRTAHGFTALALVAVTLMAGIAAALTVRRVGRDGRTLTILLLALGVILFAQMVIGRLSAEGENLLWLHVPLGVALVGFTVQPFRIAGRLAVQGRGARQP